MHDKHFQLSTAELTAHLTDARKRTLELIEDLSDDQLMGPELDIVNPLQWELGHIGFFYEVFALKLLGNIPPIIPDADELYDSFLVAHDDRWHLPLPDRAATVDYMQMVLNKMISRLNSHEPDALETYLYLLCTFHEDMHDEAFTYTRQTLDYPRPSFDIAAPEASVNLKAGSLSGDAEIPGGTFYLGAHENQPFVFDNEKWAYPVEVAPFKIARAAVTNQEFAEFVDAGGYENLQLWSYGGRSWLAKTGAKSPLYWKREGKDWYWKLYQEYVPLAPHAAIIHVNWYEAEAYCNWAGRRLPTEAEWEMAASATPAANGGGLISEKRLYPWGNTPPEPGYANLDGRHIYCVDVAAFPEGDSAFGCRQMIGNSWEWTSSPFYPFPGYIVDQPYKEYSAPWFGYQKVLRGGCWATRSRLIRNTYRNFYLPHRRDVFAGFRTCAK